MQKPEVIAPSIFVAAPILPETQTAAEAELLAKLKLSPDERLSQLLAAQAGICAELDAVCGAPAEIIRLAVESPLGDENIIARSYKHVDGNQLRRTHRLGRGRADARSEPSAHATTG